MPQSPKKTLTKLNLKRKTFASMKRFENAEEAFETNTVFPKAVEYDDIDKAVLEFVNNDIKLTDNNGKFAPTFTLFSNQRFSEYSQTWEHTDEYGNLLMDFKTVNRQTNPNWGKNQGGMHNIPGDRRYTLQVKEVLDDNGTESYEVYSMAQPLSIDLMYTISYITADWHKLNGFNTQLNEIFKSIQHYIKPNGWYMPMTLASVDDQTEYAIDNRKIYIQSATVEIKGIIVPESSYKIEKFPKRLFTSVAEWSGSKREDTFVDVEEDKKKRKLTIFFNTGVSTAEFTFDELVRINEIKKENVRDFSIKIDGDKLKDISSGLTLNDSSPVKVIINPVDKNRPSKLFLLGQTI